MLIITVETQNPSLARDIINLAQRNRAAVKLVRTGEESVRNFNIDLDLLSTEVFVANYADSEILKNFRAVCQDAISKKNPILLIKALREYGGLGLREAKDLIDKYTLS
jgi:ribosomal protein L7/L12